MPTTFSSLKVTGTATLVSAVVTTIIGTTAVFSGAISSGTTITAPVIYSTGGLLPIVATLTEANYEGDGTASGWSVQNPYAEAVLCEVVTLRTATAPTDGATTVDIDSGTGTFAQGSASGTGLSDSYTFAAAVHTASGTTVADSSAYPSGFVLDALGGTTDYILLGAETGTGGGLSSRLHANCYSLD